MSSSSNGDGDDGTDLDWLSDSILMELRGRDGEATTPELVELTGADSRHQISYRVSEKLAPQGLVETESSGETKGSQIPPTLVKLTTRGDGLAGQLLSSDDEGDGSLGSEISRLQSKVNQQDSKIQELSETVDEQADQIETLTRSYNEVVDWIEDQRE